MSSTLLKEHVYPVWASAWGRCDNGRDAVYKNGTVLLQSQYVISVSEQAARCCCFVVLFLNLLRPLKSVTTPKRQSWKAYRLVWVTAEVRKPKPGLQMWVTQHKVRTCASLVPSPLLSRPLNPCIHTQLSALLLILPLIRGHNNSQPPPSSSVLCNFIQNSEV